MLFLAILSVIIIVLTFVIFTHSGSQENLVVAPGVHKGDELTYDIQYFSDSTDPEMIAESFYQYNLTEWYKVTVTDVSNASITLSTTWRFINGTEFKGSNTVDVESDFSFPQKFPCVPKSDLIGNYHYNDSDDRAHHNG